MIDCRIFVQSGAAFIVSVRRDQDSFCQGIAQEVVKREIPSDEELRTVGRTRWSHCSETLTEPQN